MRAVFQLARLAFCYEQWDIFDSFAEPLKVFQELPTFFYSYFMNGFEPGPIYLLKKWNINIHSVPTEFINTLLAILVILVLT